MPLAPDPIKADLLLASNSPRRRELLQMIAPTFTIAVSRKVDETYPSHLAEKPHLVPEYLACKKAEAYHNDLAENEILLTADTVVILDGEILGKPKDEAQARLMLQKLSGRTHLVVTGVALTDKTRQHSFSTTTEVTFTALNDSEIDEYIQRFSPLDKAGAYGIQEWIGCIGISGIKGCFYNVMGLPLHDLYHHLKNFTH